MRSTDLSISPFKHRADFKIVGDVYRSLCRAHACGTVSMRLERCVYVKFDTQLVCVGLRSLGASTITALFANDVLELPEQWQVGANVRLTSAGAWVEQHSFFGHDKARAYVLSRSSSYWSVADAIYHSDLLARLHFPVNGLSPYVRTGRYKSGLASLSSDHSVSTQNAALTSYVGESIACLSTQLKQACVSEHSAADEFNAVFDARRFKRLIGAGPGLTPSGDDVLCGVFAALYLTDRHALAKALWASVAPLAAAATTDVSFTILEQAALGGSSETLDTLISAVGHYPDSSVQGIEQLLSGVGATSGWDWFSGLVLGLAALTPDHNGSAQQRRAEGQIASLQGVDLMSRSTVESKVGA